MAEVEQPDLAEHDIEAEAQQGINADKECDIDPVVRNERQEGVDSEQYQRDAQNNGAALSGQARCRLATGCVVCAFFCAVQQRFGYAHGCSSDLFRRLLTQKAGWPPEKNDNQDDKHEHILPGAAHVPGEHRLHEA